MTLLLAAHIHLSPLSLCCLQSWSTSGSPKGVMLSHDNITWMASLICEAVPNLFSSSNRFVSYLPLSHIAAQVR